MDVKTLDQQVSVSEQIVLDDLTRLAAQGIQVLVCNRPDGEAADQPTFAQLSAAAEKLGMTAAYIPFKPGEMTAAQRDEFVALLKTDRKVHAFCRTGNRSSMLWAAARKASGAAPDAILTQAKTAGFDVSAALGGSK